MPSTLLHLLQSRGPARERGPRGRGAAGSPTAARSRGRSPRQEVREFGAWVGTVGDPKGDSLGKWELTEAQASSVSSSCARTPLPQKIPPLTLSRPPPTYLRLFPLQPSRELKLSPQGELLSAPHPPVPTATPTPTLLPLLSDPPSPLQPSKEPQLSSPQGELLSAPHAPILFPQLPLPLLPRVQPSQEPQRSSPQGELLFAPHAPILFPQLPLPLLPRVQPSQEPQRSSPQGELLFAPHAPILFPQLPLPYCPVCSPARSRSDPYHRASSRSPTSRHSGQTSPQQRYVWEPRFGFQPASHQLPTSFPTLRTSSLRHRSGDCAS